MLILWMKSLSSVWVCSSTQVPGLTNKNPLEPKGQCSASIRLLQMFSNKLARNPHLEACRGQNKSRAKYNVTCCTVKESWGLGKWELWTVMWLMGDSVSSQTTRVPQQQAPAAWTKYVRAPLTGPESLKLPSVPCCPKMAEPVLYWAAAAGSNYWLGCGKWGQMHCIIREPVDSGSPSQWLVISKIIGERWQRFLEFFLICMSFCYGVLFGLLVSICEGWVANDTVSYGATCLCWWSQTERASEERREKARVACTCTLGKIQHLVCGVI